MTLEEIRKNAPPRANKYILYKNGDVVYLRANNFFEYWRGNEWKQCSNSEYIAFNLNMIGVFPLH